MKLRDKTVVLTGATGGIGGALTKKIAAKGAKLALIARTKEKLVKLQQELGKSEIVIYECDFTKSNAIKLLADKISKNFEVVDILINAAGVGVYKAFEEVTIADWDDSMAVNLTAPFILTKFLLPNLQKSPKAVILNIGSGMGKIPTASRSVYCATKFALRGMTLSLAAEFERTNVHFIHITLGSTLTEFGPMTLQEKEEENLKGKAYFTPEWVADKFVEILEKEQFDPEITLYPTDYSDKEWST